VVVNDQGYEYITLLVQGRSLLMHGGANGRWGYRGEGRLVPYTNCICTR